MTIASRLNSARPMLLFWLAFTLLAAGVYWVSLRFVFPGYFAPLSPFHIDFYDYVAVQLKTFQTLLVHYPRPIAYCAMKLMGTGDVFRLIMLEIGLVVVNVGLTVELSRRLLRLEPLRMLGQLPVYLLLLFTQPEFYFEHRHDLPAQASYFFLMVALISWTAWTDAPSLKRIFLAMVTIVSAVLFVFSKETYFVASIFIVSILFFREGKTKLHNAIFLICLIGLEAGSLAWNRNLATPFISLSPGGGNTYYVDLAPLSLLRTYWYYLGNLFTPGIITLICWAFWTLRNNRNSLTVSCALVLSGLAVYLPQAVLPNHKVLEYSWAGAPLLFAPLLAAVPGFPFPGRRAGYWILLYSICIMSIFGPFGYRGKYKDSELRWLVDQDRRGAKIARSLHWFDRIPARSAVLLRGLDDPAIPWQSSDYIVWRFGKGRLWTVVFPPKVTFRKEGLTTRFIDANAALREDWDYLAEYGPGGALLYLTR